MQRFLIEVPHEESRIGCARAVEVFLRSGSHFLSHADWGCRDGEHKAWMVVEVDGKEEARRIVPPVFRSVAKIRGLNFFTLEDVDEIYRDHEAARASRREAGPSSGEFAASPAS